MTSSFVTSNRSTVSPAASSSSRQYNYSAYAAPLYPDLREPEFEEGPPLDEAHWAAILRDEEYAPPLPPDTAAMATQPISAASPAPYSAELNDDWEAIAQVMEQDEVVQAQVTGFNRGGLLVGWNALQGFVPASQLNIFPSTTNPIERRQALEARIGEWLDLRVIELSVEHNRLIFSERAARANAGGRAGILQRLQPGDVAEGVITNLCDFGAFVDLGGLEGLIHISELSWGRVGHPSDLLERGQIVKVHVLEIQHDAGRVALSLKRLNPDPWATVASRYRVGEYVTGVITNVVDFGAFARIEDGLEGLIHVSELAEGHFMHPRNVVQEGQTIRARILTIDGRGRRLGLSLRAMG